MPHITETCVRTKIRESLDAEDAEQVEALLRPSITLGPARPRKHRLGQSRLGGVPDLPVGESWPHHESRPLMFVLQVNLVEVAAAWASWEDDETANPLPAEGMLYAFIDYDDARVTRLLHRPSEDLAKASFPDGLERKRRVKQASLTPKRTFSLPGYEAASDLVYALEVHFDDPGPRNF
jgi:hypothetical protein